MGQGLVLLKNSRILPVVRIKNDLLRKPVIKAKQQDQNNRNCFHIDYGF